MDEELRRRLHDLSGPFQIGKLAEQQLLKFVEQKKLENMDAKTLAVLKRSLALLADTRKMLNEMQMQIDGANAIVPDRPAESFQDDVIKRNSHLN